jgi:uncharacterized protein YjbJ (UPF0337 family)
MGETLKHQQGKVKEKAGEVTGDRDLEREGKVEQAGESVKERVDDVTEKAKDALTNDR